MAMTLDEVLAVLNQQFPNGAQELGISLALLKPRTEMEIANATARLAAIQAQQAVAGAELVRQQAQAEAAAAEARFDAVVAQLAAGG